MANVTSTYITEFSEKTLYDYQKMNSDVVSAIDYQQVSANSLYVRQRQAAVEANTGKPLYGQYTPSIPEFNKVQVSPIDIYISIPVDGFAQKQTNIQFMDAARNAIIWGIRRKKERLIYDAATSTPNLVTFASNANQLVWNNVEILRTNLAQNDAWNNGEMYLVTSPAGKKDLRTDATYTGNFGLGQLLAIPYEGDAKKASDFQVIETTLLPTGASGTLPRRSFAWHKMALVWAELGGFEVVVEQMPNSNTTYIIGREYGNAVIQNPAGLFATDITTD